MTKTYYEFITDYLENLSDDDLLTRWDDYCSDENMDNYIYDNDDFFFEENFSRTDDAVRAVCYGDYRYRDDYVIFNGYGNLESFDSCNLKDHIYMSDLAHYLEEYNFLEDEYLEYLKMAKE